MIPWWVALIAFVVGLGFGIVLTAFMSENKE